MGPMRQLRRAKPKIALADAHVEMNGCRVFLGHINPDFASSSARGFQKMLAEIIERAQGPTLSDLYKRMVDSNRLLEDAVVNRAQ